MTVRHLRNMQRSQLAAAAATDNTVVSKFRAGFSECAGEVSRYLGTVDGLSPEVRDRLMQHLVGCVHRVNGVPSHSPQTATVQPQPQQQPQPSITSTQPIHIQIPVATQASALPGATVQTLIAANQATVQPTRGSPVNTSPQGPRYVGAFQVIPGSMQASPEMAALVVPSTQATPVGVVGTTPIYMNGAMLSNQQHQHQVLLSNGLNSHQQKPHTVSVANVENHPVVHKMERHLASHEMNKSILMERPSTKNIVNFSPRLDVVHAKAAIKDTLRDEKVWRPW